MIKHIIISRHKPEGDRKLFFYEWAFIHVALQLLTPSSYRRNKRYVQHYVNPDIPNEYRLLPRPAMMWESYAEHWVEKVETAPRQQDYIEQMQPHRFSDSAMEIEEMVGEVHYQRDDFRSGGIKLIHRLGRKSGQSTEEFRRLWREEHVPMMIAALKGRGLRKYVTDVPADYDLELFRKIKQGTLFQAAKFATADGIEEFWFDSLDECLSLGTDPVLGPKVRASYARFADLETSYSLIANERVVADAVTPGEKTPPPAHLDPNSFEATVFQTGRPYHEPKWEPK